MLRLVLAQRSLVATFNFHLLDRPVLRGHGTPFQVFPIRKWCVAIALTVVAAVAGPAASGKPIDAPASTHPLDQYQVFHQVAGTSFAPPITDPVDREILAVFLDQVEKTAVRCTPERMQELAAEAEEIAWRGSKLIRMPLVAFRLTRDRKYLDEFVRRMDALYGRLGRGPDGFLDWYGKPMLGYRHPDRPDQKIAVQITGFEMSNIIAQFACLVQSDSDLKSRYAEPLRRYLSLAEDHLVKKWEARGCYKDLGTTGAVYITEAELKPIKAHLTMPHNKNGKILGALLSLYMATGKDQYLVKAIKLGTRFKHCLTLSGDHYLWHYWDPAGPWDVDPREPDDWKHWIGPEHRSEYHAMSLSQTVVLYECGLVFDRTDNERFVKTQINVCWNGNVQEPQWFWLDGRPADSPRLCVWLSPFDKRIYELSYGAAAQQVRVKFKDDPLGGIMACDWLEGRYLVWPRWSSGKPSEAAAVAAFVAKPEGQALLKELAFQVSAPGYQAPMTPSQMGLKSVSR